MLLRTRSIRLFGAVDTCAEGTNIRIFSDQLRFPFFVFFIRAAHIATRLCLGLVDGVCDLLGTYSLLSVFLDLKSLQQQLIDGEGSTCVVIRHLAMTENQQLDEAGLSPRPPAHNFRALVTRQPLPLNGPETRTLSSHYEGQFKIFGIQSSRRITGHRCQDYVMSGSGTLPT